MGPSASSIRLAASALDDAGRSAEALAVLLTGVRDLAPSDPSGSVRLMVEAAWSLSLCRAPSGPWTSLGMAGGDVRAVVCDALR